MTSSSQYLTIDQIKMESLTSTSSRGRPRKRSASQASEASSSNRSSSSTSRNYGGKKPKKYELDPSHDPTIRNALAAKKNRDKKKKEEQEMRHENMVLKIRLAELEKELAAFRERESGLKTSCNEEMNNHVLIAPFGGSANVKEALEAIMPGLNAKYGTMEVHEQKLATTTTTPVINNIITVNNSNNNNNNEPPEILDTSNHISQDDLNSLWDHPFPEDFQLDFEGDLPYLNGDDNQKYILPGDIEPSFASLDQLDNKHEPLQQQHEGYSTTSLPEFHLSKKCDPFFGLHISTEQRNVIVEPNPMMCSFD